MNQLPAGLTTEGTIGKRYLARLVDTFAAAMIGGIGIMPFDLLISTFPALVRIEPQAFWGCFGTVWLCYFALLESSRMQATLGKKLLGLKVTGLSGERIDLSKALLRTAVRDLPFFALHLIPGLNLLLVAIHLVVYIRTQRAIHDYIAKTVVVGPETEASVRLSIRA